MARQRKEVTANFATPWNPENVGDVLEGIYRGTEEVPSGKRDANGKNTFTSYQIENEETGEMHCVAGAFLARKFSQVPAGTYVWVTYMGITRTKSGNKAKDFKVECEDGAVLKDTHSEDIHF